ncbi:MAG: hypothetical protein R3A45_08730 [Bdellovibrionota bacterium]
MSLLTLVAIPVRVASMSKPRKHGKGWAIRWYDETGSRRSKTFQSYSNAIKALRKYQIESEAIKAGIQPKVSKKYNFNQLAEHWIEFHASKKRSIKDDKSILNAHLLPFFGKIPLHQITTERINEFERTTLRK